MKTALSLYRIYRHCNPVLTAISLTIDTIRRDKYGR